MAWPTHATRRIASGNGIATATVAVNHPNSNVGERDRSHDAPWRRRWASLHTSYVTQASVSLPQTVPLGTVRSMASTRVLLATLAAWGCSPSICPSLSVPSASLDADRAAVEATARGFEAAIEDYGNKERERALAEADAVAIEHGPPEPLFPGGHWFEKARAAGVRVTMRPRVVDVHLHGDIAWVTLTTEGSFIADTDAGRALLPPGSNGEDHAIWEESEVFGQARRRLEDRSHPRVATTESALIGLSPPV
jgi:hypothetical protein